MTTTTTPLLFPEVLNANRLNELSASHGLTQADLDWLHLVSLPTHAQRAAQTPPMSVETILLQADNKPPIPLAGCFTLKALPGTAGASLKPAFLYTPDRGISKFNDPQSLDNKIDEMLRDTAGRDELFRYLSISQRSELNSTTDITQTSQIINEGVFKAQIESIEHAQSLNALAMVDELIKLPTLTSMLDQALSERLPNFDQRQARVAVRKGVPLGDSHAIPVTESIPLSDAVLVYFHHQGWPAGHDIDLTHPGTTTHTPQQWETIIKATARNLIPTLIQCINAYWEANSPFHQSRRHFLSRVIRGALQAVFLIEREKGQLTEAQRQELLRLFRPSRRDEVLLFIETIRLWEYEPHFVELAGSLMISGKDHYLYTPNHGLQKVASYLGFKDALLNSPATSEPRQGLYNLLSLEERNRFLRFDQPQISGESVDLPVAESLADAIIAKQLDNLHYALEMSRQGDVNLHSLIDKALDIRTLINKSLLDQKTEGHWGTRPAFYGNLRPSNFRADQLERKIKSYTDIEDTFHTQFIHLPPTNTAALHHGLDKLLPDLTNVFSLGLRAEAELRDLDGTLPAVAHDLIRSVFAYDPEYPGRAQRLGFKGFRPDVYALKLAYSIGGSTTALPLPNCFLLTERGGLDTPYSGMTILWSPFAGLQAFASVDLATRQLNKHLLDTRKRFAWLLNLAPEQRKPHGRYQLQAYELLEDNVLVNRMKSFIEQFKAEHSYLSTLKAGDWRLSGSTLRNSLDALLSQGAPTNLTRAANIARANRRQQQLPAWLGTASLDDQRLHIELLEQYKNSVVDADAKDYLDGIEPLRTYVHKKLKALLDARFPGKNLNPDTVQITPNLAVVGPASALTDFALNHVDVTRNGFKVSSTSSRKLPVGLNETAVRQLLSSLDISTAYRTQIVDRLSGSGAQVQQSKRRFRRQLPWQLLQHAHARHLQQHLSSRAFDLIRQVLDMPDAIARSVVEGASALFRPVELIKTDGAAAVKALGLYLVGSSAQATNPLVLYSPYHSGHCFTEFKDEASVVAAFNTPGALQDLLIRRLPEDQQAIFKNLFASTLGHLSEITLGSNPIRTNLLDTLFEDNTRLLAKLLSSQAQDKRQFDWGTVLHLFSSGIRLVGRQLPGKLTFIETLWESYQDFKASSEALQAHDWKTGLHNFIAGAAEMVSLGLLNRDDTFGLLDPVEPALPSVTPTLNWKDVASTAQLRTDLGAFEATGVSLSNLQKSLVDGTYKALGDGKLYIPLAGKVFQVAKAGPTWRIIHEHGEGPLLKKSPDGRLWEIDPQRQTIRFGKAGSKMAVTYSDFKAKGSLNIEARGMAEIRRKYPYRANAIVQALETARYYSFNALHNLHQLKHQVLPGSRLDRYLKLFFGVRTVDASLINKIETAISPICQALADPSWELQNASRIVVGHLRHLEDRATAFVLEPAAAGRIYITQFFFDMGLDWYKAVVPDTFNVDAHAQAATFIHEVSHQLFNTFDIIYLDAALPFLDLISTATYLGQVQYDKQKNLQHHGLSLTTPKSKLFTEWDSADNTHKKIELLPSYKETTREILKITGAKTMDHARDDFLDPILPGKRIDVILRNADSITLLICELGRQLDASPSRQLAVP
ncbi:dermonecrotic toxin domain-containing protein [Pseudomonas thivervalensis]|uniref:dermonecrotic toxin domain-containing protein n=1 Tax=Pseudomonas thivervalensis TaxID=86265 RepID=UPI003D95A46F